MRATSATRPPRATHCRATESPIPVDAPVTIATLPCMCATVTQVRGGARGREGAPPRLESSAKVGGVGRERGCSAVRPRGVAPMAFVRRGVAVLVPLAVAAAVLVYLGRGDAGASRRCPTTRSSRRARRRCAGQTTPTPRTQLELRGGADAVFEIVVRPATSVPAKVVAYVFAIGEGEPNAVDAKVEIAPEGSVRIRRARARARRRARGARRRRRARPTSSATRTRSHARATARATGRCACSSFRSSRARARVASRLSCPSPCSEGCR